MIVTPTRITRLAALTTVTALVVTAVVLFVRYPLLPDLLPVHFRRDGTPNGWQYRTYWRVLLPVFVQLALSLTLGGVAVLLLSRREGAQNHGEPDVRAAAAAAEGVVLITTIWVLFQSYGAFALTDLWMRERAAYGASGLGRLYGWLEFAGVILTIVVAVRTHLRLGRPAPRPFVPEHWRFGQLYRNPLDPALFVPTRDGSRWTLNFGRPVAAALMGLILAIGIVAPTVILVLLLR